MGIIFDIIIIAILMLSIYNGYRKGLVKVGFNLLACIVSIIATLILYNPITNFVINNTQIDEKIENIIIENGTKEEENNKEANTISEYLENYTKDIATNAQNTAVEAMAKTVAVNVIEICVMIILFIGIRLLFILLKSVSSIITNLPIVKQFNEAGGILYGALMGLAIIYIILAIVFFIVSVNVNTSINTAIESSYITKLFYNNNIILKILF